MFNLGIKEWSKRTYVYIILFIMYIPLFFAAVFSLSMPSTGRTDMPLNFVFSTDGWKTLLSSEDDNILGSILTSGLIAISVIILVVLISLLTVYALWRQRSKIVNAYTTGTYNIPLINPDIITAITISMMFLTLFGVQNFDKLSYVKVVLAQTTMILPFGITVMLPKSEKFNMSMMEASKDLGFGPISTWFRTYFRHMMPVIIGAIVIAFVLSTDDFIITRIIYNGQETVGTQLYTGSLQPWKLAIGTFMLIITLIATLVLAIKIHLKERNK